MGHIIFDRTKVIPDKIFCIGRNYKRHIEELNNKPPEEIVIFIKPNCSISDELIKPKEKARYEGEITFLLKNGEIIGVGFGIDLTLIDIQNKLKSKGLPWEKAKAFKNSAVFSDFLKISENIVKNIKLELIKNNNLVQSGTVKEMIFHPEQLLEEIRNYFCFGKYDLLMCGTPDGVGEIKKGDILTGKIYIKENLLINKTWIVK